MSEDQTPEDLAGSFLKDELKAAAAVTGVEVASSDTKADIAAKLVETKSPSRPHYTQDAGIVGHFVDVVAGEHEGRRGSLDKVLKHAADGTPEDVLIRTRDEFNELLAIPYKNVRHAHYHGGR